MRYRLTFVRSLLNFYLSLLNLLCGVLDTYHEPLDKRHSHSRGTNMHTVLDSRTRTHALTQNINACLSFRTATHPLPKISSRWLNLLSCAERYVTNCLPLSVSQKARAYENIKAVHALGTLVFHTLKKSTETFDCLENADSKGFVRSFGLHLLAYVLSCAYLQS